MNAKRLWILCTGVLLLSDVLKCFAICSLDDGRPLLEMDRVWAMQPIHLNIGFDESENEAQVIL